MDKVVDFPIERTRTPENTTNYRGRRIFAAVVAFGTLGVVSKVMTDDLAFAREDCVQAPISDTAWESGQTVAQELQAKGVVIDDLREVTDLIDQPNGTQNICATDYHGFPLVTGLRSYTDGGPNVHLKR